MIATGWAAYEPWRDDYASAVDGRRYPIEWIDEQVASGVFGAFATAKTGMLAEVKTYPTGFREVHCMVAAGSIPGTLELRPFIEEWGRLQGCGEAIVDSRPGWQKVLKPFGYSLQKTTLRKVL